MFRKSERVGMFASDAGLETSFQGEYFPPPFQPKCQTVYGL